MGKLLSIEEVAEIIGLEYKSVTSRAQVKQSSQTLVTPGEGMSKSPVVINPQGPTVKNLVQNVKIGYFLTAVSVLTIEKNSN